jgi:hypothetical protein
VLPKLNSCRDAGDTPVKKNHQEEAKLGNLHTPSPHIASQLHVKWRNKEGSYAAKCLAANLLGRHRPPGEQISGTWYHHSHPWDKAA